MRQLSSAIVVILALAVGSLHLALDQLLFHWNFVFTRQGHTSFNVLGVLFILNFVGYVASVSFFLWAQRQSDALVRIADFLLLAMTVGTLVGWNIFRRPNPRGLGAVAVSMEILLGVLLLARIVTEQRRRVLSPAT